MIVVPVLLVSARTKQSQQIAELHICNTSGDGPLRDYAVRSLRGRSVEAFRRFPVRVQREGQVRRWPSDRVHVLNLVAEALVQLGYGRASGQGRYAVLHSDGSLVVLPPGADAAQAEREKDFSNRGERPEERSRIVRVHLTIEEDSPNDEGQTDDQ